MRSVWLNLCVNGLGEGLNVVFVDIARLYEGVKSQNFFFELIGRVAEYVL